MVTPRVAAARACDTVPAAMIRHLLIAVDFDEVSERALSFGLNLAAQLGARATVMHAYGLPVLNALDAEYIPTPGAAAHKADVHQDKLDALVAPHKAKGVEFTALLRVGSAPEEVCAVAKEIGADAIVVGTHGRGAIGRAILGNVAHTVLRTSTVPVITVK